MTKNMFKKLRNIIFILLIMGMVIGVTNKLIQVNYLDMTIPTIQLGQPFYDSRADQTVIIERVEIVADTTIFHFETMSHHQGYQFKGINNDQSLVRYPTIVQDSEEQTVIQSCKDSCENFDSYVLINAFGEQIIVLNSSYE